MKEINRLLNVGPGGGGEVTHQSVADQLGKPKDLRPQCRPDQ